MKIRVRVRNGVTLFETMEQMPVCIKVDGDYYRNPWDFEFRVGLALFQGSAYEDAVNYATVACSCVV